MKTTTVLLMACIFLFASCRKDTPQPVRQEVIVTKFSNWAPVSALVDKSTATVPAKVMNELNQAIGLPDVQFKVSNKLQSLPYSITSNNITYTYFYKWQGSVLEIYRQFNMNLVFLTDPAPEGATLIFYTLP